MSATIARKLNNKTLHHSGVKIGFPPHWAIANMQAQDIVKIKQHAAGRTPGL
jgi:hypothetical protein